MDKDYLSGVDLNFNENVSKLSAFNLSFDLQCNWHQLFHGALYFSRISPDLVVIINHLGCLQFDRPDNSNIDYSSPENLKRLTEWQKGIIEFAKNQNVYIKLSMLQYCTP